MPPGLPREASTDGPVSGPDLGLTVGLFGTCGGSAWREPFKAAYRERGIDFFDPQVPDWNPESAREEARHLVGDGIVLFPVTDETAGLGSLAETGFSFLNAVRSDASRYFAVMVAESPDPAKVTDPVAFRESVRARTLVRAHLARARHANVFACASLPAMLATSLRLHESLTALARAREAAREGA